MTPTGPPGAPTCRSSATSPTSSTGSSPATSCTASRASSTRAGRTPPFVSLHVKARRAIEHSLAHGGGTAEQNRSSVEILWQNTASKFVFRSTDPKTAERVWASSVPRARGSIRWCGVRPVSTLAPGECYAVLADGRFERRQLGRFVEPAKAPQAAGRVARRPLPGRGAVVSARPSDRHRLTVAAVHVLTAAYSVSTGISLTGEDVVAIEREGAASIPAHGAGRRTCFSAPTGAAPAGAWPLPALVRPPVASGSPNEGEFVAASAAGSPRPWRAVGAGSRSSPTAVESEDGSEEGRYLVTLAWSRRAALLNSGLPDTAPAAIEAIDRALRHCPASHGHRRSLHAALALASDARGDVVGAERGTWAPRRHRRRGRARGRQGVRSRRVGARSLGAVRNRGRRAACWLGAVARPRDRARSRDLGPGAGGGRIGTIGDVPLPARTLDAWASDAAVVEGELGERLKCSADRLPEVVRVVEAPVGEQGGGRRGGARHRVLGADGGVGSVGGAPAGLPAARRRGGPDLARGVPGRGSAGDDGACADRAPGARGVPPGGRRSADLAHGGLPRPGG